MTIVDVMNLGVKQAEITMLLKQGGPFGAVVVKNGEIISVASNTVLKDNDPTAHAEINAIRQACKVLGTHDLEGCELYASGYPCPMCISAIIWSNIKTVYYCNSLEEAEKIGFRDDFIYEFINDGCKDNNTLKIQPLETVEGKQLYNKYDKLNGDIY